MAGKLKDDQIRIILDVEAKGVQAELQKITASSFRYAESNKTMKAEMKAAEDQMKESLKEMKLLEKQGLQTSDAYKQYENTLESARSEVQDYTLKIAENTQKIAENEKQTAEIIRTMNIQDMTMSQLKQRAADLQTQMNNTSAALSPEAYKILDKELNAVKDRMGSVGNANKTLLQQFAGMHNPVGSTARAVQGLVQAFKLLLANPVVAIISAIVAVFYALKDSLFKNEEAMNSLNRIMAPLKVAFDAIVNVLQKLVVGFLDFVETVLSGISKLIEKVPFLEKIFGGVNEKAKEAVLLEKDKQAQVLKTRQTNEENAKKETQIAKLRNESKRKDLYTDQQRLDKLNEAIKLEKEITQSNIDIAKENLRILEIEAARTKNAAELNDKISQQKVLIENMERDQYTSTMRMESQISSTTLEMQRERADAAKKALQKRLQDEENALNIEINNLKKARLKSELTEKEYNKKVEELTISSLNRKLEIKGQEKDKIIQLEQQILDAQLKQQELADKELLDVINKEKEEKLQILESDKNKALELLQEQESDQKIYALHAAEIESQTANDRLKTIHSFGKVIEETEFNNNQNRIDAIKENEKEILSAETATLKEQEKLRKLFAKTTADFERQYNIKTWDQRKADELAILYKQHEAGLLSEEVYQLALVAIDKKYEDEKFKVQQQYGLVSMSELYQSEMDALQEQLAKKLISEEDFEKAKLDIKLKYAAELAQKAGEFTKVGSDTVKALEEAQTASLDAEYTKRQSALTEQYNQGLISQEEYNTQKEQLDYEEKVKELEIQKKYADVNFAMQASEIVSSGVTAAINAYKAMAGIPIVGPGLGAAAAALVAVTTGMKLKQAKAERDKVKAMTLESPGGGGSSASKTGQIKLKEGFAEGGLNDELTTGGYTGTGRKYEVAGYVPIHSGEYVIARDELRQPAIMNMARSIENVRRQRTNKNPAPAGFADGGSNSPGGVNSGLALVDNKTMDRLISTLDRLQNGDIVVQTNYGITELEAEQRKKVESESKFTKQ